MPTIITNSNRIDLVDPISGKNKSITIDEEQQKLVINQGSDDEWDISGDTDETVGALARELHHLASDVSAFADKLATMGNVENLTTTDKTSVVGAVNEVNSKATTNSTNIGTMSELAVQDASDLVAAINTVNTAAAIARGHADSISSSVTNWANVQLLPTVNSTVIAQGTTSAVLTSDWAQAVTPVNPSYGYVYAIHTGVDSTDLADNPADLLASGTAKFNPADVPNAKLAPFCEIIYNVSSTEFEVNVYASEPVALSPIDWELIIGRNITASEVPNLTISPNS